MTQRISRTKRLAGPALAHAMAALVLVVGWMAGCKPAESPPAPAKQVAAADAPTSSAEQKPGESGPPAGKPAEIIEPPEPAAAPALKTAKAVLDGMVGAYRKARSYADKGTMRILAAQGDQKIDQTFDYSLVLVRPNKIHMQAFEGVVVSDGRTLWAFAHDLPDQVAQRPAPAVMDIKAIFADRILGSAISQGPAQGFAAVPITLMLMVADDPLKTILHRAEGPPVLLPPEKIGPHECYRVQVTRPDGKAVLWIDRQSLLLRRMEFPVDELIRSAGDPKLENVSLVAEFQEAGVNDEVDETAFKFEIPDTAHISPWLLPPQLLLVGKPAPAFSFVGVDGKTIDSKSIEGKIAVIDFWATWCGPCRVSLPIMQKLYEKFKDNPKVVFLAVSVDQAKTETKQLQTMLEELGVTIPLARDPDQHAGKRFGVQGIPSACIIGANRVVQDFQTGYRPAAEGEYAAKLEKLLAGQDVFREQLAQFEAQRKEYEAWIDKWAEKGLYTGPSPDEQEIPEAKIAERTAPRAFALEPLWKCTEIKAPGNVLVVPAAKGPAKVFVLDSWKTVAEIAPGGKVAATHRLGLPEREAATFLRTGAGADGKRYYAVSGIMQQQVHLFDEDWKPLVSFPEDAAKNPHAGIADVQLGDLDADGKLEMLVSYFQEVGVHSVSLEGKRVWANRSMAMVSRIAVWAPEAKGPRQLLCTNSLGSLVMLDAQGKRTGEISIPNRLVHWIVSADLDGDGRSELCGMYLADLGLSVVIGVDPKGGELWSHTLPKGVHRRPVEQIVAGSLASSGPGQWLVPGPDGSILVIGPDGKIVDRWQTGAVVTGLATMVVDGQPALVVASPESVEAWRVKWAAPPK